MRRALQERHHGAKLSSDLLYLVTLIVLAELEETTTAGLVLGDPVAREGAVLDLVQGFKRVLDTGMMLSDVVATVEQVVCHDV